MWLAPKGFHGNLILDEGKTPALVAATREHDQLSGESISS
jgi:hypothetical protein